MSAVTHQNRRRRPPKMYMVASDHKVQDHLDGTIRLQRGQLCLEQEGGAERGARGDYLWVKVIDIGSMVKLDKHLLSEVPAELGGLLEPITELDLRFKLLSKPHRLLRLDALPLGSPVLVRWNLTGEYAEAELRYRGPLTRGSAAVYFGVQLKGWAAGKGSSNGSYKGHQLFTCPDQCALFVPASDLTLRRSSRGGSAGDHELEREVSRPNHSNHNSSSTQSVPSALQSRTAESAPPPHSPPPLQPGQRVCFSQDEALHWGTVQFCGTLPGRTSSGLYVGLLLDSPIGNWNGYYKNYKLCSIPSVEYGHLLPISKVSTESRPDRQPPLGSNPKTSPVIPPFPSSKPALQPPSPTHNKLPPQPTVPTNPGLRQLIQPSMLAMAKSNLHPPSSSSIPTSSPSSSSSSSSAPQKVALKPPPLPAPKSALKLPPVPPNKPQAPPLLPPSADDSHSSNGFHNPPSPLVPEERAEPNTWLEVGSMVEMNDPLIFGVIRWIGQIAGLSEPVAGIELDQELSAATDGSYLGERHFRCPPNKGLFVKLRNCRRDSRFPAPEAPINQVDRCNSIAFAEWGSKRVEDNTPPVLGPDARHVYEGFKKGIQGHLNSCYLDASLFSLFSCCSSVDWVLFYPSSDDSHRSKDAQELLRCEIVNPLRRYGYVCASKTMALRKLLEAETTDAGFTNEEKDPEEFLNKLFQLLRVEPLLKIRSMSQEPQECHIYQLFPPSISSSPSSPLHSPLSPSLSNSLSPIPLSSPAAGLMRVASVQALLESSFIHSRLKFTEAPSCLPLLMPRFGKEFKMFDTILPSLKLDITDLLDETLRQCSICQSVAAWECLQCYEDLDITPGQLKQYCNTCNAQVHAHKKRQMHSPLKVRIPKGTWEGPVHGARQQLDLFAVTCIETSHYVSFVKYGPLQTDWLFFDSMADREGGENGFNVPQVRACPEVGRYLSLSEKELGRLDTTSLKEPVRRLLCDAYMCLYHCPELSLYK
ncbi:ubiquitin carboxyl-terminal hydrolase CYLD [Astyanax mexicanus]|uniref:ubiquitin carboxyl-terminal hydrolase CYLD n=1 Tax=Astyanax mexicanus TaxID=7994 RepID=UPI0020CB606F|nr:ubiquitin carboxyl-terminal hydrolase CYLD [Astyanax mexicanus]